ncbi:MAG: hypothetical protein WDN30_05190 [Pararobbsia sp.]
MSFVFSHDGGNYRLLFVVGTVAMRRALLTDVAAATGRRGRPAA